MLQRTHFAGFLLALTTVAAQSPQPELAPHALFGAPAVHDIWIQFKDADYWQKMTANFVENSDDIPYIEASFWFNDVYFETIGVRFKGNSSYRGSTNKKPFRIKLNEFVKGQKIGGIASLNLNNLWNDPSFIREKLYFDLAARAGLRAPRSNFANLYINGKFWGLYGLGEVINSDFLESRYVKADQTGNLYKGSTPGGTLDYLGDEQKAYTAFYEKKTNESDTSWTDLITLTKMLKETPADQRLAKAREMLDLPSVLTTLALDNLTLNLDSYVGLAQNYFLYRRPSDNKFEWLPWDPSLAFGALSIGVQPGQLNTLPLEWSQEMQPAGGGFPGGGMPPGGVPPGGGGPAARNTRPLTTILWGIPEIRTEYRVIYKKLIDQVLNPDRLLVEARYLQSVIRQNVIADPNKLSTLEAFDKSLAEAVAGSIPGQGGLGGPGGGGPGGPAGQMTPGIEPLVRTRDQFARTQLAQ